MIFHSVRRVGFHLYMAVSTLQLTSIRNLSEYWQLLLKHTSRCRSIFGFHILLSDTAMESCVTFKPRKAPIQLIQFSMFNNQKFCRYTFLYLFRFNAIISPVTANVNSTSCVLGSFLYSFLTNYTCDFSYDHLHYVSSHESDCNCTFQKCWFKHYFDMVPDHVFQFSCCIFLADILLRTMYPFYLWKNVFK